MTESKNDSRYMEMYRNVMALYSTLKSSGQIKVIRAEMRQGEVKAAAIDFNIDVEIKASRALEENLESYLYWSEILEDPDGYAELPESIQITLGKAFSRGSLGPSGAYKSLYFKVKNQNMRQLIAEKGEPSDTDIT